MTSVLTKLDPWFFFFFFEREKWYFSDKIEDSTIFRSLWYICLYTYSKHHIYSETSMRFFSDHEIILFSQRFQQLQKKKKKLRVENFFQEITIFEDRKIIKFLLFLQFSTYIKTWNSQFLAENLLGSSILKRNRSNTPSSQKQKLSLKENLVNDVASISNFFSNFPCSLSIFPF